MLRKEGRMLKKEERKDIRRKDGRTFEGRKEGRRERKEGEEGRKAIDRFQASNLLGPSQEHLSTLVVPR